MAERVQQWDVGGVGGGESKWGGGGVGGGEPYWDGGGMGGDVSYRDGVCVGGGVQGQPEPGSRVAGEAYDGGPLSSTIESQATSSSEQQVK